LTASCDPILANYGTVGERIEEHMLTSVMGSPLKFREERLDVLDGTMRSSW
jgi:hypothetical protein